MTSFLSNHFGDGANVVATDKALDVAYRIPPGLGHGRLRRKMATATNVLLNSVAPDTLRLMTFKSSDRLIELTTFATTSGAAGAAMLGLYQSGLRHNGVVVDLDLYSVATPGQVFAGGIARAEVLTLGALEDEDRGVAIWEQVNDAIPATYAADPQLQFDLVYTCGTTFSSAVATIFVEALYVAGD